MKAVQTTPASGEPDQTVDCEADVDQTTQLRKKTQLGLASADRRIEAST